MTKDQAAAYGALSRKRMALYALAQKLTQLTTPANQDTVGPSLKRMDLELQLVNATLSEIALNAPMSFPSSQDIAALATLAAEVQQIANASLAVNELVAAADAAIATWPRLDA